jgi:putative membrane protein
MMGYGFNGYNPMGWFGGGILMFIGLIVIGLLIYWVYMSAHKQQPTFFTPNNTSVNNTTANSGNAMNILNDRYARGEIQDDEYQRKKAELRNA